MKERAVYINELICMPGSSSMNRYIVDEDPAPAKYLKGLLDIDLKADSYLNLDGEFSVALEWISLTLSKICTQEVEEVVVVTSTIKMDGEEVSRFWSMLISPAKFPALKNAAWFTGKGCNVLTYAVGEAFNKISQGGGPILVICLEMHELGVSRFSDYAFFSDAVGLVLLSNSIGIYEILNSSKLVSDNYQAFPFTCSFSKSDYPAGTKMYTLHVFPFILSRKYQSVPSGISVLLDSKVRAHYYSLDPFFDLCNEIGISAFDKLIHVESPPFHVDELHLRQQI